MQRILTNYSINIPPRAIVFEVNSSYLANKETGKQKLCPSEESRLTLNPEMCFVPLENMTGLHSTWKNPNIQWLRFHRDSYLFKSNYSSANSQSRCVRVCVEGEGGMQWEGTDLLLASLERRNENRASSQNGGLIMLQQVLQIGIEEAMDGSRCILFSFTRNRLIFLCTKYSTPKCPLKDMSHYVVSYIYIYI